MVEQFTEIYGLIKQDWVCSSGEKDGCMLLNDVVDGSVGNQAGLNSVRGAEEQSRIPDIRPSESKEFCKKRIDCADAIVWFPGMHTLSLWFVFIIIRLTFA